MKVTSRTDGIDVARAFAVVAMVAGHTYDALLTLEAKSHWLVQSYWTFRGVTAPLFLAVSGLSVTTVLLRSSHEKSSLSRFGPRIALLFFWGFLLHLPYWDPRYWPVFSSTDWKQLSGFDALQTIATSMLVLCFTFEVTRRERSRLFSIGLILGLSVLLAPWIHSLLQSSPQFLRGMGPDAVFPLTPWIGYFFFGSILAFGFRRFDTRKLAGSLIILGLLVSFSSWLLPRAVFTKDLELFIHRAAQVSVVLGFAHLITIRSLTLPRALARSSLTVYVAHLPVIYGWAGIEGLSSRLGTTLSFPQSSVIAIGLLSMCFALDQLISVALRKLEELKRTPGRDPQPQPE